MITNRKHCKKISHSIYCIIISIITGLIYLFLSLGINPTISFASDIFTFGWTPPPQEIEDQLIAEGKADIIIISPSELNPSCSLINTMKNSSPVRNQAFRPACVGFAVTSLMEFLYKSAYPMADPIKLSPGFLYCNCKGEEGVYACEPDTGLMHIYTAVDVLKEYGVPPEDCYQYSQINFCCESNNCPDEAMNKINKKTFIDSHPDNDEKIASMKSCLHLGRVFVAGIPVFSNWDEDLGNPDIPDPSETDVQVGGHALCFVAYEDDPVDPEKGYFWFKNSWGKNWGYDGYGKVSYDYMQQYAKEIVFIDKSEIVWGNEFCQCCNNHPPKILGLNFPSGKSDKFFHKINIGERLLFNICVVDEEDAEQITYSFQSSSAISGIINLYGVFDWIPNQGGTYEIKIKASDSCGLSDTATVVVEVPKPSSSPSKPSPFGPFIDPFQPFINPIPNFFNPNFLNPIPNFFYPNFLNPMPNFFYPNFLNPMPNIFNPNFLNPVPIFSPPFPSFPFGSFNNTIDYDYSASLYNTDSEYFSNFYNNSLTNSYFK